MGGAEEADKENAIKTSNLYLKYSTPVDPYSAYEFLERREAERQQKAIANSVKSVASTAGGTVGRELGNLLGSTFGAALERSWEETLEQALAAIS